LKYLGQHLYVPSAKISSETVHRNFKLASHPNKIIPLLESLHSTKSSSLLQHQYHQEYCGNILVTGKYGAVEFHLLAQLKP
jgi:hypothetical protein